MQALNPSVSLPNAPIIFVGTFVVLLLFFFVVFLLGLELLFCLLLLVGVFLCWFAVVDLDFSCVFDVRVSTVV